MQNIIIKGDQELYENYDISRFIAKGNNTVYESVNKKTKEIECVKEIKLSDRNAQIIFEREVKLLAQTRQNPNPNIIDFKGSYIVCDQRNKFHSFKTGYIQMEKGITSLDHILEDRSRTKKYFSEQELINFVKSMLDAHAHLQNISIAHRDIKPQNIIVTSLDPLEYKVCDIGVGTAVGDENTKTRTLMGTVPYLSPQLLTAYRENRFNINYNPYKSDVYSLGLVFLYFCSLAKLNYKERGSDESECLQKHLQSIKDRYHNIAGLYKILKLMLTTSQTERLDFLELQNYIYKNNLLRINNDLLRTISSKFQLSLSSDQEIPLSVKSVPQLKKVEDMVNHVMTIDSVQIILNNLNKDQNQMGDVLMMISKIQSLEMKYLLIELTLNEIQINNIKILSETIEKCIYLERLSINLWNNKLKSQGTSVLLSAISKLSNLHTLQLTLSSNYIDDDINVNALETLTNLQDLYIDLGVNRLTNPFFNTILQTIGKLSNLKNLTLNMETNRFINSQPLKFLPSKLSNLKNLESLELNLAGMSVRNEGLYYIATLANSLPILKAFSLLMWNSQIKDKAFIEFAKDFNPLQLKKLRLIIWGNDITEKGIEFFSQNITKLQQLQMLQLNLSNNPLQDQGIRLINKALISIQSIAYLKLSFDNTKLTSVGCRYIGRMFLSLKNLKEVSLSIKANKIGFQGFQLIAAGLKQLKRLCKLSLILDQCKITDNGLALLTSKITKLGLLQELSMNLCDCELSESPLGFLSACKGLKHLKQSVFDFRKNPIQKKINKQIGFQNQNVKRFDIKLDAIE